MAKFNSEVFDETKITEEEKKKIAVYLQSLLPAEQYYQMHRDWHDMYGKTSHIYPWWKYCFDNIEVRYENRCLMVKE